VTTHNINLEMRLQRCIDAVVRTSRISTAMGLNWFGVAIDIIYALAVLGVLAVLPTLLVAVSKYARAAMTSLRAWQFRAPHTLPAHAVPCAGNLPCAMPKRPSRAIARSPLAEVHRTGADIRG
jgi:hypothetical protein